MPQQPAVILQAAGFAVQTAWCLVAGYLSSGVNPSRRHPAGFSLLSATFVFVVAFFSFCCCILPIQRSKNLFFIVHFSIVSKPFLTKKKRRNGAGNEPPPPGPPRGRAFPEPRFPRLPGPWAAARPARPSAAFPSGDLPEALRHPHHQVRVHRAQRVGPAPMQARCARPLSSGLAPVPPHSTGSMRCSK